MTPRILIIEDSPTITHVASGILREAGHTVLTAENGEQGVATAITYKPDVILLDVLLPGYNGFQVCRMLKSRPETAAIPVVMITSKSNDRDRQWGMAQGAAEYMTKPFNPQALLAVVGRLTQE